MIAVSPRELTYRLTQHFNAPSFRAPLLPAVAMDVTRLASDPKASFGQLAACLAQEPMLSAQLLRAANSPRYARGMPVKSVDDAVARLGMRGTRNLVMQIALESKVFRAPRFAECMESVRRHSIATAHFSHAVARRTGVIPDEAFLVGLLHDVGTAAALLFLESAFRRVPHVNLWKFWESVEGAHCHAAQVVCRAWGLPAEIGRPASAHHDPFHAGPVDTMAATVSLADHFAKLLGAGVQVPSAPENAAVDSTSAARLSEVNDALNLDAKTVRSLYDECRVLLDLLG
jgi:HD-like signal output (HDOD) protein